MPLTFAKLAPPCCAALLLLAACEEEAAEAPRTGEQGGKAAGEVLGGTISDDMLPLERLRSQSPPLEREPDGGGDAEPDGEDSDGGAEEEDETPATAPAPAPAPASTGLPIAPPVAD